MTKIYTAKDGELRLYDGTSPTPYYLSIPFAGADFSGPEGRPRPEENLVLNRGVFDDNAHYYQGGDEGVLAPLALSFSALIDDTLNRQKLRDALCNLDGASPWTVGGNSWATTKGTTQLKAGDGTLHTTPAFADSSKVCVNVEILWNSGANDIGRSYAEVYFPPDQVTVTEGAEGVRLDIHGLIYGEITEITAFTAGTAS